MTPLVTVLQHHPAEGPGRIKAWARARRVRLRIALCRESEALPEPRDGLIILGGPQSIVTPLPPAAAQIAWLRSLVMRRPHLPVLGICLGGQMLARALGAAVRPLPTPETGWTTVTVPAGDGTPGRLEVLQWHEDGFEVPARAHPIAVGDAHAAQGFAHGHRIGLQFHPEWDEASILALRQAYPQCPLAPGAPDDRHAAVERWLFTLLDRWLLGARSEPLPGRACAPDRAPDPAPGVHAGGSRAMGLR